MALLCFEARAPLSAVSASYFVSVMADARALGAAADARTQVGLGGWRWNVGGGGDAEGMAEGK